jgi:hypothetical protein
MAFFLLVTWDVAEVDRVPGVPGCASGLSFGFLVPKKSQLWKRTFLGSQKLITETIGTIGTIGYEPLMGLKSDILIKYIFCPESW